MKALAARRHHRLAPVVLLLLALLLTGAVYAIAQPASADAAPAAASDDDIAAGQKLFQANCATCHGPTAEGREAVDGGAGGPSLIGVGAAAQSYWGKDARRLSLAESALLAGMIRAPNRYALAEHPERARQRRDLVLHQMRELGMIDDAALNSALAERSRVREGTGVPSQAPYFLEHVRTSARPDGDGRSPSSVCRPDASG